jgi:peptide/nickel transport system substrate-binding protein
VPAPAGVRADGGRHPYTIPHVLRYATGEDIVGLNPHLNQQLTLQFMTSNTMAWLLKYDRHNDPVPELATAVPTRANGGISADGLTVTYHLRRDAKWSDGAPFTSDDVRFSVETVLNPANNEATHLGFDLIRRLDTPDAYTVVFHLQKPYSGFYVNFFSDAGGNPCILPRHLLGREKTINEAAYNALPVGIGPFKFASWRRADSVELVPDPLYFGRKPKLTKVIFKIVPDRNTVLTQLATHEVDLWLPVPAAYYDRARAVGGVATIRQFSYAFNHLDFETEHGALRDADVRRALRMAIDRPTILAKIRHHVGILQETPFAPGNRMHIDVPLIPFDVAGANRLLDRAGWGRGADGVRAKAGRRLELVMAAVSGIQDNDAIIEQIRASWQQIGVALEVKHYPSPMYFAPAATGGIILAGKFDVTIFAWFTSPNGDLTNLYGCKRAPPVGQNVVRYCRPEVDAAMAREGSTYDAARQRAESRLIQLHLVHDAPMVVLDAREDGYAFNDDLRGFKPNQVTPFGDLVDVDI